MYRNIDEFIASRLKKQNILINKPNLGPVLLDVQVLEKYKPDWYIPAAILFPKISTKEETGQVIMSGRVWGKEKSYHIKTEPLIYPLIIKKDKNFIFNFDPQGTINYLLYEKYYKKSTKNLYSYLPFHFHSIPGQMRTILKKFLKKITSQNKTEFPSWPIEQSVELIRDVFLKINNARRKRFWPKKYAVCFTHDIDTKLGFDKIPLFAEIEKKHSVSACYYIVAKHYKIDYFLLENLYSMGFEIGSHDYNHDNKTPFLSKIKIEERMKKSDNIIKRFNVKGFRSPCLLRSKNLFDVVEKHFLYDSSIPDTEFHSEISRNSNGCCTVFPFMIGNLIEIPITMPQDARLKFLGLSPDEIFTLWMEKLNWIKKLGGVAVFNIHPEPHLSGNPRMLKLYERLVKVLASDSDAWITTPVNVAEAWRENLNKI